MKRSKEPLSPRKLTEIGEEALSKSNKELNSNHKEYSFRDVVEEVVNKAAEYHLEFVGHGSNRLVFEFTDRQHVVKFPVNTNFRDGTEQNRVEAYIWNEIADNYHPKSPIANRFFEVVESGANNTWLIMKQADATTGSTNFNPIEAREAIINTFPYLNRDCEFCIKENIGWNQETQSYAIYDYGSYIPQQFVTRVLGSAHKDEIGDGDRP